MVDPAFTDLGLDELGGVKYSIWLFVVAAVLSRWCWPARSSDAGYMRLGATPGCAAFRNQRGRCAGGGFAISGLAAGIAGAIIASRTGQGQAGDGIEISLFAFAAVVVGGTSVLGGRGNTWRTVLGVLFLGLIVNGFNLIGVDPIYQQIVGAIGLLAVAADGLSRQR